MWPLTFSLLSWSAKFICFLRPLGISATGHRNVPRTVFVNIPLTLMLPCNTSPPLCGLKIGRVISLSRVSTCGLYANLVLTVLVSTLSVIRMD